MGYMPIIGSNYFYTFLHIVGWKWDLGEVLRGLGIGTLHFVLLFHVSMDFPTVIMFQLSICLLIHSHQKECTRYRFCI